MKIHSPDNDLEKLRVPGVLQRFSIAYVVVASFSILLSEGQNSVLVSLWSKIMAEESKNPMGEKLVRLFYYGRKNGGT